MAVHASDEVSLHALPASAYARHARVLDDVPMNTLFARAVLDGRADGRVEVDDVDAPRAFYILHDYGMALLCGAPDPALRAAVVRHARNLPRRRAAPEWLQASPAWHALLASWFAPYPEIELHRRLNFMFDAGAFGGSPPLPEGISLERVVAASFDAMPGSVVPPRFWRSAAEFAARGVGFDVMERGQRVCRAFSAFREGAQLELGIETLDGFRGRGLARLACARLIEHCLAHDLTPVWACRAGNVGSVRLALGLGFAISQDLPYYRLSA